MTSDEVRGPVVDTIRRMIENAPPVLTGDMSPIDDLGLDSWDGLDFVDIVSEELGISIPADVNPFRDDKECRATTLDEIVALLANLSLKENA